MSEMERYQRQVILPEIGAHGQELLGRARVLIVGAGGLGCPALSYLVAAGVGSIAIVDSDRVELSNLHRQPLYAEEVVGRPKAEEAARVLRSRNSSVSVTPIVTRVSPKNIRDLVADIDIIVDGSDNFATKYLLSDASVVLGKELVSGAISRYEGQLSVFNGRRPDGSRGPTYRCLFPTPPPVALAPACGEAGVLGVLPGVVGTLQAVEVIKLIVGIGEPLIGRMLLFDALGMRFSEVQFERVEGQVSGVTIGSESSYSQMAPQCKTSKDGSVVRSITASQLRELSAKGGDVALIDVREPWEKAEFDLGGELIPLAVVDENLHRIPREGTVVVYCRSGARSARAISLLQDQHGYTNLLNLEGGGKGWTDGSKK